MKKENRETEGGLPEGDGRKANNSHRRLAEAEESLMSVPHLNASLLFNLHHIFQNAVSRIRDQTKFGQGEGKMKPLFTILILVSLLVAAWGHTAMQMEQQKERTRAVHVNESRLSNLKLGMTEADVIQTIGVKATDELRVPSGEFTRLQWNTPPTIVCYFSNGALDQIDDRTKK